MVKLQEYVVSVLLPVYNAGEYLPACLESLKKQTYTKIQVIAIDDNSKDNSYTLLKKFQKSFKQIEVYKNKKRYGLSVCYNRALKRAKGHFIVFISPHDINGAHRFKRQVNYLLKNAKTVAVGTQYVTIDKDNKKLEKSNLPEEHETIYNQLLTKKSLVPETIMFNRMLLPMDLLYFKNFTHVNLFMDIFVKLFQYGKVTNLPQYLYYRRVNHTKKMKKHKRVGQLLSTVKMWVTYRSNYDYRPQLRSLFPPIVKGM